MKARRATILVGHSFCTYVTEVGGTFLLYSHPSVVGLISGTSAVSLVPRPRPTFRSFSVLQATESWAGAGNEATVSRDYLSSCFIFCPRLTSLCSFCSAVSVARRALSRSILRFLFSSVVCRVLAGHFENKMVPYRQP